MAEVPTLNTILRSYDINFQVNIFTSVFQSCQDSCAPTVIREVTRPPVLWITADLKESIKNKNKVKKEFKSDGNNIALESKYRNIKKKVRAVIKNSNNNYFKKQFRNCKGNISKTWKTVKILIPNKNGNSKEMEFKDSERKANEFNHFFASVGKNTFEKTQANIANTQQRLEQPISLDYIQNSNTKFRPKLVTVDAVILVIKTLNESNAFSCDGITLQFIRDVLPVIVFYITVIVNASIVTGTNSPLWKHGQIVPQFKSGDPDEPCNYRPMTLLPYFLRCLKEL